jgi:hypothetical protein
MVRMRNPPRIWVDYRPVRIGWVISCRDVAQLATAARWNTCLWGGRHNCIIPSDDMMLANGLVATFGVDLLLPVQADDAVTAFINRFPHLHYHQPRNSIFSGRGCEFADIRHPLRRIVRHQDRDAEQRVRLPVWQDDDPLAPLFATMLGAYPAPTDQIPDYKAGVRRAFGSIEMPIAPNAPLPVELLGNLSPLALTGYDLHRDYGGWLEPGVVLGSVGDFDALLLFWNLRAAGAPLIFYDQKHSARLKPFADAFLARFREPQLGQTPDVTFWIRADRTRDDSWKPDLELDRVPLVLSDGRGHILWNGMNIKPQQMRFSAWHRDVVPAYSESDGKARASFALPDRPFDDDDVQSLSQKFAVIVAANQYGEPEADFTFETPFVPRLNEFYGRRFHFGAYAARSQASRAQGGAVALATVQISLTHAFSRGAWHYPYPEPLRPHPVTPRAILKLLILLDSLSPGWLSFALRWT